jgi:spore germination protein GerM
MFTIDNEFYGQSGLYNALHQSNLSVQGIDIDNGHATIALNGDLQMGGTCDTPRIEAQLTQTALQYSTIDTVSITINGQPLEDILSAAGS